MVGISSINEEESQAKTSWRMPKARWNHNIHYHPRIVAAVPSGARVLDVGCGEGMLTRELAVRAGSVLGIDIDAPSIEPSLSATDRRPSCCRAQTRSCGIT
jgi:2-polyprenyl-3-methyl-5-hydroxy-6-metoxy-1,4-benzoquinol methylase